MKYQILFDYGSEGFSFYDDYDDSRPRKSTRRLFDTIDEAVKFAVGLGYSSRFIIVTVHWEPLYTPSLPSMKPLSSL